MDIRHFDHRESTARWTRRRGDAEASPPTLPPPNLVAREARRQTRKVLNPAWNRMRSFRVCTVDDDDTTKVGDSRSSAPEKERARAPRSATLPGRPPGPRRAGPGAKEQSRVNWSDPPHPSRDLPSRRLQWPIRRLWIRLRSRWNRRHRRHCHRGGRLALDGTSVGPRRSRARCASIRGALSRSSTRKAGAKSR